jgi:hypothetical protein
MCVSRQRRRVTSFVVVRFAGQICMGRKVAPGVLREPVCAQENAYSRVQVKVISVVGAAPWTSHASGRTSSIDTQESVWKTQAVRDTRE